GPRGHGGDVHQEGEGAWTRGVRHASLKLGSGLELALGPAKGAVDCRQVVAVILGAQADERRVEGWRTSPSGLRAEGRGYRRRRRMGSLLRAFGLIVLRFERQESCLPGGREVA